MFHSHHLRPLLLSSILLLPGCQTLNSNTSDVSQTETGAEETTNNTGINKTAAQVGGGVLGGLVGSQFGNGSGQVLMTIAGAIGGAFLGGELIGIEDETTPQTRDDIYSNTPEETRSDASSVSGLNKYCHKRIKYHQDVPVQVDVAYVRYKRAFGYMTHNEHIRAQGLDPKTANKMFTQMNRGFRHIVEPGVRYHMKESVDLDTGYSLGWLSLELEKSGTNSTRVYVNYCEGGNDGFDPKYSEVIKKKIDNAYL